MALIVALLTLAARCASAAETDATRHWVVAALAESLNPDAPHWNRAASLLFPLTRGYHVGDDAAVDAALADAAVFLSAIDLALLSDDARADYDLMRGFLADAGVMTTPPDSAAPPVVSHAPADDPFTLANQLNAQCGFDPRKPGRAHPGFLQALIQKMHFHGGFSSADPLEGFYLDSHATLALHLCAAPQAVRQRAQAHLAHLAPLLMQRGALDALTELLVFLNWMRTPLPMWRRYDAYIESQVNADGGLCRMRRPGCASDWHATSLLLEWRRLKQAAHNDE
ncbi:hypothetical protein [Magnetofaba australis]|uniref:Uncharacterized protein n=1 Tax=Magnetofaba australis IT-1 TaxID=1434232 RepID=A0A1Y2K2F2_9PROT|nr:hypothetical protein [Magnetofaba australis]OSM02183.1 hypothetical protein MAIT1_02286 [Magnetofaba australis IT-1]